MTKSSPVVKGKILDQQTRCAHYHSSADVIAIKFKCCNTYYPCHLCHAESVDHPTEVWSMEERDEKAVFCGMCQTELTIRQYMDCNSTCPHCNAAFNPGCEKHYPLYFET